MAEDKNLIGQFSGLGMYDEGGKFEVKQEFIDEARAKAIQEGKKYYGDATNFEVFRDSVLNLPDAAINFVARGAEGTGELVAGIASLAMKGGQLATTTDPDKITQIRSEPSFTKYMGAYRDKIPTPNLYESNISGGEDTEKAFGTAAYYAAPIPVLPIAKGVGQVAKGLGATKFGKNMIDELETTATYFPNYTPFKKVEPKKSVGAMSIDELIESNQIKKASEITDDPLNLISIQRERFQKLAEIKKNRAKNLSEAPIVQTSKTKTKTDPTAPGRSKIGTIKYGDKEMVKDQVFRYNEAAKKINSLKENVFNITKDSSTEAIETAGKTYANIVKGNDDVLKIALGNELPTSGYNSIGNLIQRSSGIDKAAFQNFKFKHPLRSGASLDKASRLNSAIKLLEDYRKANPKSLGIEINFRKLKEILGESEEFKNIFADIPVEVLDAKKISGVKNLTREEKYIESVLNNYQADFVTIEKYLKDLKFDLARPFNYRAKGNIGGKGKRMILNLTENQTKIFSNKRTEIQQILKEIQTVPIGPDGMGASTKVKDFLRATTERMKSQGASEANIIKAVGNIDSNELARLILKREEANLQKLNNLQEYEEIAKTFGGNPPKESLFNYQLGHIKALEDSIESSLDMNNVMIQTEYANNLDNQVRNYVKNKIKQLTELSSNNPKDAVLRQRLLDDLEQIDEIAKEEGVFTMIGGKEIGDKTKAIVKESDFPKDEGMLMNQGGIVGIDNLTQSLRNF